MPRQPAAPKQIYRLKITLKDSKPPIWRRVETPDTVTLAQLHQITQAAMGWYDYHMHQFTVGRVHYGVPDPDDFEEVRDERRIISVIISSPCRSFSYRAKLVGCATINHRMVAEQQLDKHLDCCKTTSSR